MTPEARRKLNEVANLARPAAIAEVGGFRPPEDPCSSWFGRAVSLPGEGYPTWDGEQMAPLLQIRVSELPFVPEQLKSTALLALFINTRLFPFEEPHGEGWLIREYESVDELMALPTPRRGWHVRPFPIRWSQVDDDHPGWEDCWSLVDLEEVSQDKEASDEFFDRFATYPSTKVWGYPSEIQHGIGLDGYVFQVGSEEKANWMWVDHGIGYFFKRGSNWEWSCQFY